MKDYYIAFLVLIIVISCLLLCYKWGYNDGLVKGQITYKVPVIEMQK